MVRWCCFDSLIVLILIVSFAYVVLIVRLKFVFG